MDIQLQKINEHYPQFFPTIQRGIIEGCKTASIMMNGLPGQRSDRNRYGTAEWLTVEPFVEAMVRDLNLPDVTVKRAPNELQSSEHLEIHFPYAVIMLAKAPVAGGVPKFAKYRQAYIDQSSLFDWDPSARSNVLNLRKLYIVTYVKPRDAESVPAIYVGQLSSDQRCWRCNHPISVFQSTETTETTAKPILREEIAKTTTIRLKDV